MRLTLKRADPHCGTSVVVDSPNLVHFVCQKANDLNTQGRAIGAMSDNVRGL